MRIQLVDRCLREDYKVRKMKVTVKYEPQDDEDVSPSFPNRAAAST